MPAQKRTAASSKPSKPTAKRQAKSPKPAAARKRPPQAPKHEGLLDSLVEGAKEVPGQVAHGVGQLFEKAGEVVGAAAEKTGALVGEVAEKVGLGDSKQPATRRSVRK
jgi:hypothetical protein